MPAVNIECQIARGQIGRYINGDALSPEAVRQLESHIAECEECKAVVAERRMQLLNMLGGKPATHAVVQVPSDERAELDAALDDPSPAQRKPNMASNAFLNALKRATQSQDAEAEAAPKPKPKAATPPKKPATKAAVAMPAPKGAKTAKTPMWRPLALSGALAIVLIGMSYATRPGGNLLGPKSTNFFDTLRNNLNPSTKSSTTPIVKSTVKPTTVASTVKPKLSLPATATTPPVATTSVTTPTTPVATTPVTPAAKPATPATTPTTPATTPAAVTPKPAADVKPKPVQPEAKPASEEPKEEPKPVAVVRKVHHIRNHPRVTVTAHRKTHLATAKTHKTRRHAPKAGTGTIKVYTD